MGEFSLGAADALRADEFMAMPYPVSEKIAPTRDVLDAPFTEREAHECVSMSVHGPLESRQLMHSVRTASENHDIIHIAVPVAESGCYDMTVHCVAIHICKKLGKQAADSDSCAFSRKVESDEV